MQWGIPNYLSVFVESYDIYCRVAKFYILNLFFVFFIIFHTNEYTYFILLLNVNIDLITYHLTVFIFIRNLRIYRIIYDFKFK